MGVDFDLAGLHDEHTIRAQVPQPLSELCVRVLAANFASRPTLRGIAPRYINRVTELLPTNLPLEVTGPLIDDEGYWKRACLQKWPTSNPSSHDHSWKVLYFERTCQDALEVFDGSPEQQEDFLKIAAHSKD